MYAAIYGYNQVDGYREHLGNVISIEHETVLKTYDLGTMKIKGSTTSNVENGLLVVINSDEGKQQFSGFMKNLKPETDSSSVSFFGDDLKKIFDTDVILDFSQSSSPSHTVHDIFQMVCDAVGSLKDPFISKLTLSFTIPADSSDTMVIANYTGQYLIVNAIKFLKVYLSYFGYYIKSEYDILADKVKFTFVKANSSPTEISLKDFIHEKTSNDLKTNKVVATIKFETVVDDPSWIDSDESYFNSNENNRATMVGLDLPSTEGYSPGFALRLIESLSLTGATESEYTSSENKSTRYAPWTESTPPTGAPSLSTAIAACGNPDLYGMNAVIKVLWISTNNGIVWTQYPTYVKTIPGSISYHKIDQYTYLARPSLPEKIYTLGKDSQIYEGYAPDEKRIYPIVTKIFESAYLSEAQVNAVYELVNNRYIENILVTIENVITPLDLSELELYTMIRVYDSEGEYKDLPVSEKTYRYKGNKSDCVVKLGFKKTLLTEIIKNDIGADDVVKKTSGGSVGTNLIREELPIWEDPLTEPDTNIYKTWFRPVQQ